MATDLSSFCLICDVCVSMMRKQFVSLFVCLSKLSFFFPSFLIFYFTNLSLFCGVQWIDLVRCEKQLPIHFGLLFPCIQNIYYIILYYIILYYCYICRTLFLVLSIISLHYYYYKSSSF